MTQTARTLTALTAAASLALAAPAALASTPDTQHVPPVTTPADHGAPTTDPAAPTTDPVLDACGNPAGETVFSQFHDRHSYLLAPDGGFENGAADWTLDGSSVGDGNETFNLANDSGTHSLSLPAGSSATSPAICVGKGYPIFRTLARTDGSHRARLRVEVLYLSGRGGSRVAGKLRAGHDWRPTKKLAFALGRARAAGEDTGNVAFRFTAVRGAWQVDDVYVDPRMRH
jgi:hypothetical protein